MPEHPDNHGFDLHTHSNASDGFHPPAELVEEASRAGIHVLALTDHDTTAGLPEARRAADKSNIRLVAGVEISVTWQGKTLHILGLNIDPESGPLRQGLSGLQTIRRERALEMGDQLARRGIPDAYQAACALAGTGMVTRTHFARHLNSLGLAASVRDVFNRYLTPGKPGYVATRWADMENALEWIRLAGGTGILAHPPRYRLTGTWMRRLLGEFGEAGGKGIEVVSGTMSPSETNVCAGYASQFGLLASAGSDFHDPAQGWPKLGRLPPLPPGLTPVWHDWPP